MTTARKGPVRRVELQHLPPAAPRHDLVSGRPRMMYAHLLDEVREQTIAWLLANPGHADEPPAAKIAECVNLAPKRAGDWAYRTTGYIRRWLGNTYPDEVWTVHQRSIPETWSTKEIWVRYFGVDAAKAAALRQFRRDRNDRRRAAAATKRQNKAAAERMAKVRHDDQRQRFEDQRRSQTGE